LVLRLACAMLVGALVVLAAQAAGAANSPTHRDCAFSGGLDPDYVELLGVTADSHGGLTVPASQTSIQVKASESSDPGDSNGHDTLALSASAPGRATQMASGAAVGKVVVSVPLASPAPGTTYTISWTATFDNGNHHCPGAQTPQNATAHPFVVTVSGSGSGSGSGGGTGSHPKNHKKHRRARCHRHGKPAVCRRPKHR
jgi:hypothetical protein